MPPKNIKITDKKISCEQSELEDRVNRILTNARKHMDEGDYYFAMNLLSEANSIIRNNNELSYKINKYISDCKMGIEKMQPLLKRLTIMNLIINILIPLVCIILSFSLGEYVTLIFFPLITRFCLNDAIIDIFVRDNHLYCDEFNKNIRRVATCILTFCCCIGFLYSCATC